MYPIEKMILPDHYSREGHKPILIVNHVTVGSKQSVINTFKNTANKKSSTYLNCRDGSIVQFVDIQKKPKTNGTIRSPKSSIIKQMGTLNPNYYTITIENEDAYNDDTKGVDGQLTEAQFRSLCWLHKHIQTEVKRIYGTTIPLNSSHVIGHRDIDSIGKALCPGPNFPMDRLLKELAIADTMTLEEYEEHLDYTSKPAYDRALCYSFAERVQDLGKKLTDKKYGAEARRKLMKLSPIMEELNYSYYEGDTITAEGIVKRILDVYKNSHNEKFEGEAFRKLNIGATYAKSVGIL